MSQYRWHPDALTHIFLLPAAVADRAMKIATPEQLRVLIWFSRHGQPEEVAACAEALGLTPEACEACLSFWAEQGILAGGQAPTTPPVEPAPAAKTPRPAAVKPRVQEVLDYQRRHPDFRDFLQAASIALGKAISPADTATLLYLLDTVGLPGNVILLEIGYAVSIGKGNMRYIEKLALNWADEDITTPEAADRRIRELEQHRCAAQRVERLLALDIPLNLSQAAMAHRWIYEWHFSDEMLRRGAAIAAEKTGKFSPAYLHKILERWHVEGVNTPDKIAAPAPTGRKKTAAATNPAESSLDMQEFEESLIRYRPKFKVPTKEGR